MKNTNKNKLTNIFYVIIIIIFPILLASCDENKNNWSSLTESEPTATQIPTVEPTSPPIQTEEPVQTPETSDVSNFEQVFADNPIDAALKDDLDIASTTNAIIQAYNRSTDYWKLMIEIAYSESLKILSENERDAMQMEQQDWESVIDSEIADLLENVGDSSDEQINAAIMVRDKYRDRAKSICYMVFLNSNELPDFEKAILGEAMG